MINMTQTNIDPVELRASYFKYTNAELAKKYNVSISTLGKLLKEAGVKGKKRGRKQKVFLNSPQHN